MIIIIPTTCDWRLKHGARSLRGSCGVCDVSKKPMRTRPLPLRRQCLWGGGCDCVRSPCIFSHQIQLILFAILIVCINDCSWLDDSIFQAMSRFQLYSFVASQDLADIGNHNAEKIFWTGVSGPPWLRPRRCSCGSRRLPSFSAPAGPLHCRLLHGYSTA
jgi:hypothetical protein